jgi:hypothetical protein
MYRPHLTYALRSSKAVAGALLVIVCTLLGAGAGAQTRPALKNDLSATPVAASRPAWNELGAGQRAALAPLAHHWDTLTENHKRKWIAMVRNFDRLPVEEQTKMHGRMSAWAGLSTMERDQARLNYAEARKVGVDEKKARWEAYQALSDEQRDKLASSVAPKRPGVAAPARPGRAPDLVRMVPTGGDFNSRPRVGVPAASVDHNTLLPQHLQVP